MKKLSPILALLLAVCLLAGCAGTPVIYYTNCTCPTGTPVPETTKPTQPAEPVEGALKLGLTITTGIGDSKSATAEADGEGKYDVTIVAVLVDDEGIIRDCIIDGIAASVKFNAQGKITSDLSAAVSTKNELGEAYGMKAWGGAIAEWNEQAASFAAYVTGKTAAQVAGIAVNEGTKPTDADLAASVTIAVGGFQALIAKAAK
jgi:heme A synthase